VKIAVGVHLTEGEYSLVDEIKQVLLDQRTRLERKFEKEKLIERDTLNLKKYLN